MFTIIATAMVIALLCGLSLGLSWPHDDHVDYGPTGKHPLDGPTGPIIRDGEVLR